MKKTTDNLKSNEKEVIDSEQSTQEGNYFIVMFIAAILGFCNFLWINFVVTSYNRK